MAFTPPIHRVNTARGHKYVDADGRAVPGVTSIIGDGVPKPALINWAGNATAGYAVDNWDELTALPASQRLTRLKKARYEERDAAANKGTAVHLIGEQLVNGQTVPVPDELLGYAESYARFLDEFDVKPLYVESTVISYKHGYAGTLDLIADVLLPSGARWTALLDLKTNRSGVFGETALQLAAYRYADVLASDDGTEEIDMPDVDGCGAVHVAPEKCELIPISADEQQFRRFLYAQQIAEFARDSNDLLGAPVESPTTSTYRLVEADS